MYDKIIHIQEATPGQIFTDTESCNSQWIVGSPGKDQSIARCFLAANAGKEAVLRDMRSQFPHQRIAG